MDIGMVQTAVPLLTQFALKAVGAIALWVVSNQHYWQVYFDTNRAIREAFGEAGFPAAEQAIVVRTDGQRLAASVSA